jgi:hypothetical protein
LTTLHEELTDLLHRHDIEANTTIPDWILAQLVIEMLTALAKAMRARDALRGPYAPLAPEGESETVAEPQVPPEA